MQPSSFAKRRVTASDVAAQAGVSKWTVSRAFTEGAQVAPEVRERIKRISAELGYSPNLLARSLSTRKTHIIGLVMDELGNPNQLKLLNEVTRQLQLKSYSSLLLNISSEYSPANALTLADQLQVDGLLFLGTTLTHELIHLAQNIKHIPLVVMFRNSGNAGIPFVSTDGFQAGQEIAQLFVECRYRKIGYMAGPTSESTELRRFEGFKDALQAHGIALSTVLKTGHYQRSDGMQSLMRYIESTPRDQRVEALFCENDILAIGAMDALLACHAAGKMAIVGFDDIELASSPAYALTTFRQPMEFLVAEAIDRLLDSSGQSRPSHLSPGTLILRSSHKRDSA